MLFQHCNPVEPCDYKSGGKDTPPLVDIGKAFAGPQSGTRPPAIPDQLNVLQTMLLQGNVVGKSAGAWLHKVEHARDGIFSAEAKELAHIHQCALDGRKHGSITDEQVKQMGVQFRETPLPHWHLTGTGVRIF